MAKRFQELNDEQRRNVWTALNSGTYYLFTGSGVSLDSDGKTGGMQSGSALNSTLQSVTGLSSGSTLQQNYRLLSEDQIENRLTIPYSCAADGETIRALGRTEWRRVYTLNIDNCFEKYVRNRLALASISQDAIDIINYSDLYRDRSPELIHSVVHLHGFVEKPDEGYVFSYTEYARQMARQNPWMATLTQLMRSEPFIIAGTSLEEIDVEFYLQQHQVQHSFDSIEPPSIIIEPYPNALTEKVCEEHKLVLYEGDVLSFYGEIESEFSGIRDPFLDYKAISHPLPNFTPQAQILFESSFEPVPRVIDASMNGARFLLGAPISWGMLKAQADIPRSVVSTLERAIDHSLKSEDFGTVYLSDPGSGRSALLRKVAYRSAQKFQNVFFFTGLERLSEDLAAEILGSLHGDVIVFIDNLADSVSYLVGIIDQLRKRNICFICAERGYRYPYLSDALSEYDVDIKKLNLDVSKNEAKKLIEKNEQFGLSNISQKSAVERGRAETEITGNPISIANCRIQNNFLAFDQIIQGLIKDSTEEELKFFVLTAMARYAYSGGVSKAVLHSIPGRGSFSQVDNLYARLPVVAAPSAPGYIVPARAAVSERVLEVLKRANQGLLFEALVELCKQLAPRVNRVTIGNRTPESKLSGGLMDFDRTVQRFIDPFAERFYEGIAAHWEWNSRYWEQLALMKLSRFLEDQSDPFLLQESIQNARYAFSIDEHPLSLTTLAKTLFAALEAKQGDPDTIFSEAWSLIYTAIEIEKGWTRVKPTAFIVAFKGVATFVEQGGQLSGEQADEVREAIAITYQRKLQDRKLSELRESVRQAT